MKTIKKLGNKIITNEDGLIRIWKRKKDNSDEFIIYKDVKYYLQETEDELEQED